MPPPKRKTKETSLDINSLSKGLLDGLKRAAARPTIYLYKPHAKQLLFHEALEKAKLYVGGNRAGKTTAGVTEDIWWLLGRHPYRPTPPPPITGRIVSFDFEEGVNKIIIPEFLKWLPPSELVNGSWEDSYNGKSHTLTLRNGSVVEFMSYEQDILQFAGTSRHFIHFDEEPPKGIFTECLMRLIDVKGSYWVTMTPLDGSESFIYTDLYEPGQVAGSGIRVIEAEMLDNPYISRVEAEQVLSFVSDPSEREAREKGKFVLLGGKAFPRFRPDIHVIPAHLLNIPIEWPQYASMDHGLKNPTSWHYHAVAPNGVHITFDELYGAERTIEEWANILKEVESRPGRKPPIARVGDPSIVNRNAETKRSTQTAYAQNGIAIALANNDQRYGVDKMNNYLTKLRWFITDNNVHLIKQLPTIRWKTWANQKLRDRTNPPERLHDYNNHATDDARYYFATLAPDIHVTKADVDNFRKENVARILESILHPGTPVEVSNVTDWTLAKSRVQTDWTPVPVNDFLGDDY